MAIGATIRQWFGPWEGPVTDIYRAFFLDIGRETRTIQRWMPEAKSILEIGCGEGAICQRLAKLFPKAQITGIDITPKTGRLFQGDRSRVQFAQQTIEEFAPSHPQKFDLVLLCDVLHHVPWDLHENLLKQARSTLKPHGGFVFKDWERRPNIAHALNYFSDRVLTGDQVRYGTQGQFRRKLQSVFGPQSIERELRLPPWANNIMFLVRASGNYSA